MVAAAAAHIAQGSIESHATLCGALESLLRTTDRCGDPDPAECDGVALLEAIHGGRSRSEFLGYCWLVTSQLVTPIRVRFWTRTPPLKFELRFGIAELCMSEDDLNRMWRRGQFPPWSSEWAVCFRG